MEQPHQPEQPVRMGISSLAMDGLTSTEKYAAKARPPTTETRYCESSALMDIISSDEEPPGPFPPTMHVNQVLVSAPRSIVPTSPVTLRSSKS